MGMYETGDTVTRNMTIRVGGVLTDADPGYTATLYVNGTASATVVTATSPSTGEYVFSYTVPTGLADNSSLAIKVVGTVGGTGFTYWLEDQYSEVLRESDYACIADWVLRQPVSAAETSVCTGIPDATANSLLYLVKNMAPSSAWFTTIVTSNNNNCSCGSINCSSCSGCCY